MQIEELFKVLPNSYSPQDREFVMRAFRVADQAHTGQMRASGEPYISHCIAVAKILAEEMYAPPKVIAAGLLHDTVEDTEITLDDLKRDFGEEIANLVDAVTKLTTLPRVSRGDQHAGDEQKEQEEREVAARRGLVNPDQEAEQLMRRRKHDLASETLRKTFLAMADDPRVVLIKLSDRLHNMRTLRHMPEHKQRRIANETMDIFAPLASRLGIWQMKWDLEDLAFRYIHPDVYKEIVANLAENRLDRETKVAGISQQLTQVMKLAGLDVEISGRPKHIYSIYRKMQRKGVPFDLSYFT